MASGQTLAKDAIVRLADSGGTVRTVSADLNSGTLNYSAETPEVTAYGDGTRARQPDGIKDWSLEYSGFFNDTASTGVETILAALGPGASTTACVGPAGSTSGNVYYSGCCILSTYSIPFAVDGMANISFTLVARSGSLTRLTF